MCNFCHAELQSLIGDEEESLEIEAGLESTEMLTEVFIKKKRCKECSKFWCRFT